MIFSLIDVMRDTTSFGYNYHGKELNDVLKVSSLFVRQEILCHLKGRRVSHVCSMYFSFAFPSSSSSFVKQESRDSQARINEKLLCNSPKVRCWTQVLTRNTSIPCKLCIPRKKKSSHLSTLIHYFSHYFTTDVDESKAVHAFSLCDLHSVHSFCTSFFSCFLIHDRVMRGLHAILLLSSSLFSP